MRLSFSWHEIYHHVDGPPPTQPPSTMLICHLGSSLWLFHYIRPYNSRCHVTKNGLDLSSTGKLCNALALA